MGSLAIYLSELATQVTFAKRAYTTFHRALRHGQASTVFYHAHHFLIYASNIDKRLDVRNNPSRSQALNPLLANADFDLKPFRQLRNHLEHFDERLDRWIQNFRGTGFLDMNIVSGAVGFPYELSLRTMNHYQFMFYYEPYDLDELLTEIRKVERALSTMASIPRSGWPPPNARVRQLNEHDPT